MEKLNEVLSKLSKGGGKGAGAGLGFLVAAGGLAYAAANSFYTGEIKDIFYFNYSHYSG